MKFQIKHRYNDSVLFEMEADRFVQVVEAAVKQKADLWGADLREADLRGADLWGADLRGANLREANLRGADLWEADLREANLREADLREADLRGANLRGADLREADLWGADLREADLREANLWGADLWEADLRGAETSLSELLKSNSVATLLQMNWGDLPSDLTLEMMRHDAESCGLETMQIWADGGICPFDDSVRDYFFTENRQLWEPGEPKLRGIKLLEALWVAKGGKLTEDKPE